MLIIIVFLAFLHNYVFTKQTALCIITHLTFRIYI